MAEAPNLPTDVAPGDPGHAALHNDVNTSVNELLEVHSTTVEIQSGNGVIHLQRVGGMVTMYATGDLSPTLDAIGPIPEGYRPAAVTTLVQWFDDVTPARGVLYGDAVGSGSDYMLSAEGGVFGFFNTVPITYPTTDAYPAPGI